MNAILFDLDGVVYEAEQSVPGAAQTIAWVRQQQIPHLFVTNTTSRPRSALVSKLASMAIEVEESAVFSPPVAAHQWLRHHVQHPIALFVPENTRAEFTGLSLLDEEATEGAGAVVVGDLGEQWDFATLNRAFRPLMAEPSAPLVALGMTRYWRAADGLRLDVGAFVSALEYASGRTAVVLGKPSADSFHAALSRLGATAGETLMVGDDIRSDIQAAQQLGMRGALVRTGKFRPEDLQLGTEPTVVLESIAQLPEWWRSRSAGSVRPSS